MKKKKRNLLAFAREKAVYTKSVNLTSYKRFQLSQFQDSHECCIQNNRYSEQSHGLIPLQVLNQDI